jgi:hypothetical protein
LLRERWFMEGDDLGKCHAAGGCMHGSCWVDCLDWIDFRLSQNVVIQSLHSLRNILSLTRKMLKLYQNIVVQHVEGPGGPDKVIIFVGDADCGGATTDC